MPKDAGSNPFPRHLPSQMVLGEVGRDDNPRPKTPADWIRPFRTTVREAFGWRLFFILFILN